MKKFVFSLLLMTLGLNSFGNDNNYRLSTQYAGEIGFLAVGFGAEFRDYIGLDLFYGLVPADIGGNRIETVALKNNYKFHEFELGYAIIKPYLGLAIFHILGKKYKTSLDNSYPTHYYQEASVRGLFYAGVEVSGTDSSENSVYFEMGINDFWLTNYYNNPDVLDLRDYVSLALGWSYRI